MSDFPTPETYKTVFSKQHLKSFNNAESCFVLKKAKGAYLYDIRFNRPSPYSTCSGYTAKCLVRVL